MHLRRLEDRRRAGADAVGPARVGAGAGREGARRPAGRHRAGPVAVLGGRPHAGRPAPGRRGPGGQRDLQQRFDRDAQGDHGHAPGHLRPRPGAALPDLLGRRARAPAHPVPDHPVPHQRLRHDDELHLGRLARDHGEVRRRARRRPHRAAPDHDLHRDLDHAAADLAGPRPAPARPVEPGVDPAGRRGDLSQPGAVLDRPARAGEDLHVIRDDRRARAGLHPR